MTYYAIYYFPNRLNRRNINQRITIQNDKNNYSLISILMGTIETNVVLQVPVSNTTTLPPLRRTSQLLESVLAERNSY
jgi:hypothetical protein